MEETILLSILIQEYKKEHPEEDIPEYFNNYPVEEKIELIKQALIENKNLKSILEPEHINSI